MHETRGTPARAGAEAKVREVAASGLTRAADAAERAAAWAQTRETAARGAPAMRGAAERLERAASYVEVRSLDGLRADLEGEVRRHPVRTLLTAAGGGFLLGSLFR